MQGYRDDELSTPLGAVRRVLAHYAAAQLEQRLYRKRAWNYNPIAEAVMKRYLRLRHQLVPYLYTMNYYASRKGSR